MTVDSRRPLSLFCLPRHSRNLSALCTSLNPNLWDFKSLNATAVTAHTAHFGEQRRQHFPAPPGSRGAQLAVVSRQRIWFDSGLCDLGPVPSSLSSSSYSSVKGAIPTSQGFRKDCDIKQSPQYHLLASVIDVFYF